MPVISAARLPALMLAPCLLLACEQLPDTVGEAAPQGTVWDLQSVDNAPAGFAASIQFAGSGTVTGRGPCSRYSGVQNAPLPWLEIGDLETSGRSCPEGAQEQAYLAALTEMEFAEIAATNMLLSNAAGRSLFFKAR